MSKAAGERGTEVQPDGALVWRFSRKAAGQALAVLLLLAAPFLGLVSLLAWSAFQEARAEGLHLGHAGFLIPLVVLSIFWFLILRALPGCVAMLFDRRPALLADQIGLSQRDVGHPLRLTEMRSARWDEIEDLSFGLERPTQRPRTPSQVDVFVKRGGKRETWAIQAAMIGAEPRALFEALDAQWRRHTRRAARVPFQDAPRPVPSRGLEWTASRSQSVMVIVMCVFAIPFILLWSAGWAIGLHAIAQQGAPWFLMFFALPIGLAAFFLISLVRNLVEAIAAFFDKRPRLIVDHEGVHRRAFEFLSLGFPLRTLRWSDIEKVDLVQGRRGANYLKLRARRDGRKLTWTLLPLFISEYPHVLFDIIDAEWRRRTLKTPRGS